MCNPNEQFYKDRQTLCAHFQVLPEHVVYHVGYVRDDDTLEAK